MKLYKRIAKTLAARKRCQDNNNIYWFNKWEDDLQDIENNVLPSGSGFDIGIKIDRDNTKRIILYGSFHKMNDHGIYVGWVDFSIHIIANLEFDFEVKVFCRDRYLKEYIGDTFNYFLEECEV